MWVYRSTQGRWEVGYYTPGHAWIGLTLYAKEREAMRAVHYLNGGDGMPVPWINVEVGELE